MKNRELNHRQTAPSETRASKAEGDGRRKWRFPRLIAFILALAVAGVGLTASVKAFHNIGRRSPPTPTASAAGVDLLIPGTDVPIPPPIFDVTNDQRLLLHAAGSADRHLFFGLETVPDSSTLTDQALFVLQYYKDTMTRLGWRLVDESPELMSQVEVNGFPSGAVAAGQDWEKGGEYVLVQVGTWNQWTESWNLSLVIRIN
jgi:hypothetical protein